MSLSSTVFLVFTALCVTGYYVIPARAQWAWLLTFSYIYYIAAGPSLVLFLIFSTVTTYAGAYLAAQGKRWAVVLTLILNFGLLGFLKYANFLITNLNRLPGIDLPLRNLLLPLGISFYMFQTTGYVLDVWWKRCEPETNIFHFALFVSFFPQIMQGPIGRYSRLAPQFFAPHVFDAEKVRRGFYRCLWGFFKKMVIADNAVLYVTEIFDDFASHPALALEGALFYGLQLYADFSGGVDIVLGVAEMLDITMDENFRRPFFAVSVTDFWHRWHITLGTWMKDYLFYPLSLSKWMGRFGKWCRTHLGKSVGRALPIAIANVIVFLVVGVWHGAEWHYIFYGLYNGIIIGVSGLLAKPYRTAKKRLHIDDKSTGWHIFRVLRTFFIVTLSWFFDRASGVRPAVQMLISVFTKTRFSIGVIMPDEPEKALFYFLTAVCGALVLFASGIMAERGTDLRSRILALPAAVRILLSLAVILMLGFFGNFRAYGGFIYANF